MVIAVVFVVRHVHSISEDGGAPVQDHLSGEPVEITPDTIVTAGVGQGHTPLTGVIGHPHTGETGAGADDIDQGVYVAVLKCLRINGTNKEAIITVISLRSQS